MGDEKVDPSKKDPQVSSADDLTKTAKKGDAELIEEELKRISGGVPSEQGYPNWIEVNSMQFGVGRPIK